MGNFAKEDSLKLKGVAILMMLWHHCFLAGRFDNFAISFWPLTENQAVRLAAFFKICVSLFAFISGYGLWHSYQKKVGTNDEWIKERYVRTMSPYWFVVILSWIVCMAVDQLPVRAYNFAASPIYGCWNMLLEFLGLSNLFGSGSMNGTWWYMSAAIIYIVLSPLLVLSLENAAASLQWC